MEDDCGGVGRLRGGFACMARRWAATGAGGPGTQPSPVGTLGRDELPWRPVVLRQDLGLINWLVVPVLSGDRKRGWGWFDVVRRWSLCEGRS
jgi:hypothetical protein